MELLSEIALPLIHRHHYPEGARHVIPLLQLTLPAIDLNDPDKAAWAFAFYSVVFTSVPVAELSDNEEGMALTQGFYLWLSEFFSRCLCLLQNLSARTDSSDSEHALVDAFEYLCFLLFQQLDERGLDIAFEHIENLVRYHVIGAAISVVAALCSKFGRTTNGHNFIDSLAFADPKRTLQTLLPLCVRKIKQELENLESEDSNREKSDNILMEDIVERDIPLRWYLTISNHLVSAFGSAPELLQTDLFHNWRAMLCEIWPKLTSRGIYKLFAKSFKYCIHYLTQIYLLDIKLCESSRNWTPADELQWWGITPNERDGGWKKQIAPCWKIPSTSEKKIAAEMIFEWANVSLTSIGDCLTELTSGSSHVVKLKRELCKQLTLLREITKSIIIILADHQQDSDSVDTRNRQTDEEDGSTNNFHKLNVHCGTCFSVNDQEFIGLCELKTKIVRILEQIVTVYFKFIEDDLEVIQIAIKVNLYPYLKLKVIFRR
jgi:hypothetical protein